MPELGWIIAAVAVVGLVVLAAALRRQSAQSLSQTQLSEQRSEEASVAARTEAKVAVETAEQRAHEAQQRAQEAQQRLLETQQRVLETQQQVREAKEDAERGRVELESRLAGQREELREARTALERRESRLHEREDRLSAEAEGLVTRAERLDTQRAHLREQRDELVVQEERLTAELERIAGLSEEDALKEVLAAAEKQAKLTATALARDIEGTAKREADQLARRIVTTAIQRVASEQTSESVVSTVDLPHDDMKGRIIGREGRNIRAFEQITGVNVLIDDTPESVLLSSFDPVRRETARLTLVDLIADGRIHPARIEEVHDRSLRSMDERVYRAGEDALAEVGIVDLDPDLIPIVGALAFRTSYGQNVLRHLVECAHLAGVMAAELGLDIAFCKRAAFLHDIGKALTHEVEGPHAIIGAELLRKHGEHEDIAHAVEAHHNEVEPRTVEAVLVQAADAISGSRPGARRESLEAYVERMENLEHIATEHDGVLRAYAMQAGREVRVMVAPDHVDDAEAHALARDIAAEIEKTLSYPGQIKITVVRESRASATAH